MKAVPEKIDIHFVGHHLASHLGVGNEKNVLVGRPRERYAARLANNAARSIAAGHPTGYDFSLRAIGMLHYRRDGVVILLEADEFCIPLDRTSQLTQAVAHNAFIVIL